MSIFVTTTKTGTARASAKPRCSLVMPTIPALAPICGEGGEGGKLMLHVHVMHVCIHT